MNLDIYFHEDVANRLLALAWANERTLRLAQDLGANSRDIALVRAAYQGALEDVATSFGLGWPDLTVIIGDVSCSQQPMPLSLAREPKG